MKNDVSPTPSTLLDGVFLLNKPLHLSSNHALQKVKRFFKVKKAGHTGSLDPLATGMLPICLGEATKFSQFLLDADKCYQVTGILGIKTATSDSEGDVIEFRDPTDITLSALKNTLTTFLGEQQQVPSMYSALKHNGVPLYKLARQGIEIERKPRTITIRSIELTDVDLPAFSLKVVCSKGTYIRNLIEDIGEKLGVGAHVSRLHRNYSMPYQASKQHALQDLSEKSYQGVLPVESMLSHLPTVSLSDEEVNNLYLGKPLLNVSAPASLFSLYDAQNVFIGVGEKAADGSIKSRRLLTRKQ